MISTTQNQSQRRIVNFDPLKEVKVNYSPLALILSGRLQNQYGDHLIIVALSSKSVSEVRDFFEVVFEAEDIKLKATLYAIHAIGKEFFLEKAKYLGKIDKKTMKKIDEKIKLILELDVC